MWPMSETDQYWLSYGSAKFNDAMTSFEASTCQALDQSILAHFQHIMYIRIVHDTIHHHAKQGAERTSLWCPLMLFMPRGAWHRPHSPSDFLSKSVATLATINGYPEMYPHRTFLNIKIDLKRKSHDWFKKIQLKDLPESAQQLARFRGSSNALSLSYLPI